MEFKVSIDKEDLEDYLGSQLESNLQIEITGINIKDGQLIIKFIVV